MTKDCWVCKQKAEWRQEKLTAVRNEAKTMAGTVAIVRNGCIYSVVELNNIGSQEVIEYVNND